MEVLFVPDDETMYPGGLARQTIWIDPGPAARNLCGSSRPGHFLGVATVVAKFFHIVKPHRAYFGQKDAQQGVIIRNMVRDLAFPLEIHIVDTVRESDGLAMSSRNRYLTAEYRRQAPVLNQALGTAQERFSDGTRDALALIDVVASLLRERAPLGRVEYIQIVDGDELQPVLGEAPSGSLLAGAVVFGSTRLIDNTRLQANVE